MVTQGPADDLRAAQEAVAHTQSSEESVGRNLQNFDEVAKKDRSLIVKIVIGVYSGAIALFVFYFLYIGLFRFVDVSSGLADLIKVAVLPIVTLVIGYYFGSSRNG